jgi:hypothetical protein
MNENTANIGGQAPMPDPRNVNPVNSDRNLISPNSCKSFQDYPTGKDNPHWSCSSHHWRVNVNLWWSVLLAEKNKGFSHQRFDKYPWRWWKRCWNSRVSGCHRELLNSYATRMRGEDEREGRFPPCIPFKVGYQRRSWSLTPKPGPPFSKQPQNQNYHSRKPKTAKI